MNPQLLQMLMMGGANGGVPGGQPQPTPNTIPFPGAPQFGAMQQPTSGAPQIPQAAPGLLAQGQRPMGGMPMQPPPQPIPQQQPQNPLGGLLGNGTGTGGGGSPQPGSPSYGIQQLFGRGQQNQGQGGVPNPNQNFMQRLFGTNNNMVWQPNAMNNGGSWIQPGNFMPQGTSMGMQNTSNFTPWFSQFFGGGSAGP